MIVLNPCSASEVDNLVSRERGAFKAAGWVWDNLTSVVRAHRFGLEAKWTRAIQAFWCKSLGLAVIRMVLKRKICFKLSLSMPKTFHERTSVHREIAGPNQDLKWEPLYPLGFLCFCNWFGFWTFKVWTGCYWVLLVHKFVLSGSLLGCVWLGTSRQTSHMLQLFAKLLSRTLNIYYIIIILNIYIIPNQWIVGLQRYMFPRYDTYPDTVVTIQYTIRYVT